MELKLQACKLGISNQKKKSSITADVKVAKKFEPNRKHEFMITLTLLKYIEKFRQDPVFHHLSDEIQDHVQMSQCILVV